MVAQPQDDINYMRNSVKAVVDAYDGTVKLYAWDETDPVLQTWRKAFPDVVQPKTAISADLLDHLRYPQDLFKVQRQILARYHMTDPDNWYSQSSLWEVPNDPVAGASAQTKEPPFYLSVKWPGDDDPIFSLTSVLRAPRSVRTSPPTWRSTPTPAARTTGGCGSCRCPTPPRSTAPGRPSTR